MALALKLAARGSGKVSPNPMVGAVIVRNRRIIGQGWHKYFGGPHAEIEALKDAGRDAKGSEVYVNLEPCSHFGKTPPCTDALINAGVRKVVCAMNDPNPVAKGGLKILKKAGIKTECGIMENEARKLNEAFVKHVATGMPFVVIKMAMSLDGKIATGKGESRWISGASSRKAVGILRRQYDAVMVGIKTLLKDNSGLLSPGHKRHIRIVLDSKAMTPVTSKAVRTVKQERLIVVVTRLASRARIERLRKAGVEMIVMPGRKIEMRKLMRKLGKIGISGILLEGGGEVNASAIKAGVVDRVCFFIAPKIIGGRNAKTPVEGAGVKKLSNALTIKDMHVRKTGQDICVEGYLR